MIKKTVKILLGVLFLLVALFWALGHFYLGNYVREQLSRFGQTIGYEITVGDISISPLLLQARVSNISVAALANKSAETAPLFKLKQLDVDARFWPLLKGDVTLKQVALDAPQIVLARTSQEWNWQSFVAAVTKATTSATPTAQSQSSMRVRVDALLIDGARLAVRDGQKKTAYDLGPFSLHLTELSNQNPAAPEESGLSSKYVLNLGRVVIPLPKVAGVPDRQLAFHQVTAVGYLIENAASALKVGLDLSLDDGKMTSTWQVSPAGALKSEIHLAHLAIQPWVALAPSYEPLISPSGVIDGDLSLKQDQDALTVDADIQVNQLDIRVQGSKEPLLAWTSTSLSQFHLVLPRAENKPGLLTINDVLVDRPRIRFVMDAQRQSNFRSLFSKPEPKQVPVVTPGATEGVPAAPAVATPASPAAKTSASSAPWFRYDVRTVRLKNGFMHFSDESIKPVFRVDVTDLNGSVQGISNEPNRYASLVLNGRAAKTGSLRARGQLAFADPRQNNDVSLIFRNIPLNATNPYTMTFAGYAIDDGRIDVDLRYVTKNGALEGKNRFVIKKIKLGEQVADYEGTRLPLGLAIALLEDSDGMIDVNIPVKGNVNEPEFSVGHLVWQAVKTVLANVVTAPFRALGALLGIENVDAIAFVPGESALPPDGEEQLVKIAEFLAKRPRSTLVIHGTYDPTVDSAELARAMADRAILEASGIKVVAGEPLPLPNLTDPKVKAGLKTAYGAQVGRIKLGQRLLTLPDSAERDTQLRQELIQSYKISDEQLNQLATRRAEAVKAKIQSVDGKLVDRVSVGDSQTVTADEAGVPIRVDIMTAS